MSRFIRLSVEVLTHDGKPFSFSWERACPARHPSQWALLARSEVEARSFLEGWTLKGAECTIEQVPALGVPGVPRSSILADYDGEYWTFRPGSV